MGGWKAALTGRLESPPYEGVKQIELLLFRAEHLLP
jgi:hypothetical protein